MGGFNYKNVVYHNGYFYMDKDGIRDASKWEILHAIGEAFTANDVAKLAELTCCCGYSHLDCCPEICTCTEIDE